MNGVGFSGPVSEVANFLIVLYQEGYQYNSVNAFRSSVHEKGSSRPHPIIMKGIFNVRPPIPRYSSIYLGCTGSIKLPGVMWAVEESHT